MRVTKWVELAEEVEIDIGVEDIRAALAEAFAAFRPDSRPNSNDVNIALNSIGAFLNALTDEHIGMLSPEARGTVAGFLLKQAARFGGRVAE